MSMPIDFMSPPGRPFNAPSYSSQEVPLTSFLSIIRKNNPNETIENYLKHVSLEVFYNDITQLAARYDMTLAEVVYSLQSQIKGLSSETQRVIDLNRELLEIRSNIQAATLQPLIETIHIQNERVESLEQQITQLNSQNEELLQRIQAIESRVLLQQPRAISTILSIAPVVILAGGYLLDFKSMAATCKNIILNLLGTNI